MARLSPYLLLSWVSLCVAAGSSRADPVNEPVTPRDTTPVWWHTMESPPVFVNTSNADAPLEQPVKGTALPYVPATTPSFVEAGINYYNVTHDLGNTFGQFVNTQYQANPWNRWSVGLQHATAFHDNGEAISVGNNHVWNEDYFTDVGASLGSTASFLTRYRFDASLSRIWLDNRNLITSIGVTWDEADQIYTDRTLHLAASYYFMSPWIVQLAFNLNDSDPGSVIAPSATGAVTYGYQERYFLTARYTLAREAYEILNSGSIQNSFTSHTFGLNWRQWVDEGWGFNLGTEYYINPYYDHFGGTASVFKEF